MLSSYFKPQLQPVSLSPRTVHRILPKSRPLERKKPTTTKNPRQKYPKARWSVNPPPALIMATKRLLARMCGASAYIFTSIHRVWMALHPDFRLTRSNESARQKVFIPPALTTYGFGHSSVFGFSTMVILSCASYECKGR